MNFFIDLLIILISAVIFTLLFSFFRIPQIVIFILTGLIIGPSGLKIIKNYSEIELISEIGIILLLFTIGLEFSIKDLRENKKDIVYLGFLQVFLTILISVLIFSFFYSFFHSLFFGVLISLSSTAITLKVLQDQNQIYSISGKIQISISIFQDLAAVLFIILLPLLKNIETSVTTNLDFFSIQTYLPFLIKIIGFLFLLYLLYKFIIPFILNLIVKTRNKDLFVLSILSICFGIAIFTYKIGLSLALGAFLAGLFISETEYSNETMSNILPFKIVFTSIFFISIGMLIDIVSLLHNFQWFYSIVLAIFILLIKFLIIFFLIYFFYKNTRISFLTGIYLSQIGEFSFVLLQMGLNLKMIDKEWNQIVLFTSIITMLISIFLMEHSYKIYELFEKFIYNFYKKELKISKESIIQHKLKDHIIIIGYGINGKNVVKAAKIVDIPYVIVEMNPKTVREEREKGEPIYFGDATNIHLLEKIHLEFAKMIVIAINDPQATEKIIKQAKKLNPNLYILARTRYISEVPKLIQIGANEVIPEEFETSIQIFRRILEHYQFSLPEIQFFAEELRISGYEILRRNQ